MNRKKTPAPQRAGTADRVGEFARLVLELAVTNPARLRAFGDDMIEGDRQRSPIPNEKG